LSSKETINFNDEDYQMSDNTNDQLHVPSQDIPPSFPENPSRAFDQVLSRGPRVEDEGSIQIGAGRIVQSNAGPYQDFIAFVKQLKRERAS
jgi:hypothetical protein